MSWLTNDQVILDLLPILVICAMILVVGIVGTLRQFLRKNDDR